MRTIEGVEQCLSTEYRDLKNNTEEKNNIFNSQCRVHREVIDKGVIIP